MLHEIGECYIVRIDYRFRVEHLFYNNEKTMKLLAAEQTISHKRIAFCTQYHREILEWVNIAAKNIKTNYIIFNIKSYFNFFVSDVYNLLKMFLPYLMLLRC